MTAQNTRLTLTFCSMVAAGISPSGAALLRRASGKRGRTAIAEDLNPTSPELRRADLFIRLAAATYLELHAVIGLRRLYFTDLLWPDFGAALDAAIASYRQRERTSAAPAVGRPRRVHDCRSRVAVLKTRIATALVLVPLVLAALFLLPPSGWAIVVLVLTMVAAWEWARLSNLGWPMLLAFTAVTALACLGLLHAPTAGFARGWPTAVVAAICGLSALFWLLIAPVWVLRRWTTRNPWSPVGLTVA